LAWRVVAFALYAGARERVWMDPRAFPMVDDSMEVKEKPLSSAVNTKCLGRIRFGYRTVHAP